MESEECTKRKIPNEIARRIRVQRAHKIKQLNFKIETSAQNMHIALLYIYGINVLNRTNDDISIQISLRFLFFRLVFSVVSLT